MCYNLRKEANLTVILFFILCFAEATIYKRSQRQNQINLESKSIFQQVKRDHLSDTATNRRLKRSGLAHKYHCGEAKMASRPLKNIVSGDSAIPHSYPFMAYLIIYDNRTNKAHFQCGATIIGDHFLLTAAHCLRYDLDVRKLYAMVGVHDITKQELNEMGYSVDWVKKHEQYKEMQDNDDIALVHTWAKISFNDHVSTICLTRRTIFSYTYGERNDVAVTGWGKTDENEPKSNVLKEALIRAIKWSECGKIYEETTGSFCAGDLTGGRGDCVGDAGGPLFLRIESRYYQFGIGSWPNGCARPNFPAVFVNVSNYFEWIEKNASTE